MGGAGLGSCESSPSSSCSSVLTSTLSILGLELAVLATLRVAVGCTDEVVHAIDDDRTLVVMVVLGLLPLTLGLLDGMGSSTAPAIAEDPRSLACHVGLGVLESLRLDPCMPEEVLPDTARGEWPGGRSSSQRHC